MIFFTPHLDRYKCKLNPTVTDYIKAWKTINEEFNLADFWRIINPEKLVLQN